MARPPRVALAQGGDLGELQRVEAPPRPFELLVGDAGLVLGLALALLGEGGEARGLLLAPLGESPLLLGRAALGLGDGGLAAGLAGLVLLALGGLAQRHVEPQADGQQRQDAEGGGRQPDGRGRVALRPLDAPLPQPGRAGGNGAALAEALQVGGERLGAGVPLGGRLLEALQADGLEVARHARLEAGRRDRVLAHHLQHGVERSLAVAGPGYSPGSAVLFGPM